MEQRLYRSIYAVQGYSRVHLKAGEQKTVKIDFPPRERFECWDNDTQTMRVIPGRYELLVGASSDDSQLQRLEVMIP